MHGNMLYIKGNVHSIKDYSYTYVENYYYIKILLYSEFVCVTILPINDLWLHYLFTCGQVNKTRVLYLSVDVHNVPGVLEVPNVIVVQQSILLIGVEQGEVLHDDGWKISELSLANLYMALLNMDSS